MLFSERKQTAPHLLQSGLPFDLAQGGEPVEPLALVLYLAQDRAVDGGVRGFAVRGPVAAIGGPLEICLYGWREGAGHRFFGPNNATDLWDVRKISPQRMMHLTEKAAGVPVQIPISGTA